MISQEFSEHFAHDWVNAWNSHDIEAVLSHYSDDFEMQSPYIEELAGVASGVLHGKAAVRAYWCAALQRIPDLHFDIITVLRGSSSIVIHYRGVGRLAAEMFHFGDDGLVKKSFAHYS